MNLSERCDQSVSKVIGTWNAVTWIPCQELLLCTTFGNVSGNPHRNTDSQGSLSTHRFIVMLRATSYFPGQDVLQCLWELRPVRRWVSDRNDWTSTNKIAICSDFHVDRLQLFHRLFFAIFDQLGTLSCLCSKLILSRPFGIVPELSKGPSPGRWNTLYWEKKGWELDKVKKHIEKKFWCQKKKKTTKEPPLHFSFSSLQRQTLLQGKMMTSLK